MPDQTNKFDMGIALIYLVVMIVGAIGITGVLIGLGIATALGVFFLPLTVGAGLLVVTALMGYFLNIEPEWIFGTSILSFFAGFLAVGQGDFTVLMAESLGESTTSQTLSSMPVEVAIPLGFIALVSALIFYDMR